MNSLSADLLPGVHRTSSMTVQEYAYLRLRKAIMLGAIEPGTSLTIRGLAGLLELSPTPVREAIRRLSSEHAIQVQDNRRLIVPQMEAARFEELIQLRITLECHAAERALPYVSQVLVDQLTQQDEAMDTAISKGDLELLTELNQTFHRTLYGINPTAEAIPLIECIWLQLGPFQRQVVEELGDYYNVDRHKEILNALRERNVMALVVAVENDIRDGVVRAGRARLQRQQGRTDSTVEPHKPVIS